MGALVFGIVGGDLREGLVGRRPSEGLVGRRRSEGWERVSALAGVPPLRATSPPRGLRSGEEVGMQRVLGPAEAIGARDPSFSWAPELSTTAMPRRASRFGVLGPDVFGGVERRSLAGQPKGNEVVVHRTKDVALKRRSKRSWRKGSKRRWSRGRSPAKGPHRRAQWLSQRTGHPFVGDPRRYAQTRVPQNGAGAIPDRDVHAQSARRECPGGRADGDGCAGRVDLPDESNHRGTLRS